MMYISLITRNSSVLESCLHRVLLEVVVEGEKWWSNWCCVSWKFPVCGVFFPDQRSSSLVDPCIRYFYISRYDIVSIHIHIYKHLQRAHGCHSSSIGPRKYNDNNLHISFLQQPKPFPLRIITRRLLGSSLLPKTQRLVVVLITASSC